jgi:hypothetical protein
MFSARPRVSEPEIRQVAVADGNPGARHQKAIDRGHQAAEQGVAGCQAKGGIGHVCPLLMIGCSGALRSDHQTMYTRCQKQLLCLHSSMTLFAVQQKWGDRKPKS